MASGSPPPSLASVPAFGAPPSAGGLSLRVRGAALCMRRKAEADPISFVAALAPAPGKCLTFDNEGEARLMLIVSQTEAAALAQRLPELMDTSFRVTVVPE